MKAIKKAVSYGYVNVFWFRGGLLEWQEKGFPTETH
jgi:rhodanese-related sulfurtransferase